MNIGILIISASARDSELSILGFKGEGTIDGEGKTGRIRPEMSISAYDVAT